MKRILQYAAVAVLGVLANEPALADGASSSSLNVQGILRTIAGDLQSTAVGLVVNLYASKDATSAFYSQSFTTVPVENGFFSVELSGTNLSFDAVDAWVGIQVAGDAAEMPRQHLTAVPYAFTAARSNNANTCDVANSLSATATVSATQVSGDASGLTNLNGAAIAAGSIPKAALGPWITHTHGVSITRTSVAFTPLTYGGHTAGTVYGQCSNPCPAGTAVVGGTCDVFGTGCDTNPANWNIVGTYIPYPFDGNSGSNIFCCRGSATSGNCNLNVTAICVATSTGAAP